MTCIIHDGYIGVHGYGLIAGRPAHRIAWSRVHGQIPKGMVVRHKCDNPACVNVDHLELGTQLDNIRDRQERGRQAIGLTNARTKLTLDMIRLILRSNESSRSLAKKLGVSHTSVQWARRRVTFLSRQVSD